MDLLDKLKPPIFYTLLICLLSFLVRVFYLQLFPIDWNWESYHHWQIRYLSLHIGFPKGRFWDLNGCEYYWGMLPHVIQSILLKFFSTTSIQPYRTFNILLGALNAGLVYLNSKKYFISRVAPLAGILFSIYPFAAIFDNTAMQDTLALFLLLHSLYSFHDRPFWSGIILGLSGEREVVQEAGDGVVDLHVAARWMAEGSESIAQAPPRTRFR